MAYGQPTSGHRTDGSESSSLLPTPEAKLHDSGPDYARANRAGSGGDDLTTTIHRTLMPTPTSRDGKGANQRQDDTCLHGALMPTPRATDGTKGGPNQRGSSGDMMLPSAVQLLPTPAVNDMDRGKTPEAWDEWTATMRERHGNGNGHGPSLEIEALRLLPTPAASDMSRGAEASHRRLAVGQQADLPTIIATEFYGAPTPLPSTDGNEPLDVSPQLLLNPDAPDSPD